MFELVLPSATVALIISCLHLANGMAPLTALISFFLYFLTCVVLLVWVQNRPY